MSAEKHEIDPRYIREINGRKLVLYAGLVDLAERMGLQRLDVELVQVPSPENNHTAICKAMAELENGRLASDIGEASPESVDSETIAKFLISLSSTRSKARCIRNLCGISMTTLEECGSLDGILGDPAMEPTTQSNADNAETPTPAKTGTQSTKPATVAQLRCMKSMAKRKKWTVDELTQHCRERYSADTLETLTRSQASDCIQYLQAA